MRLDGRIALVAKGEAVRREVGFWDRFKKVFGKNPKLETDRVQTLMTTAHLLAGVKRALDTVGVTNAIALVIDGETLFEDREGRADDVGDLFAAFYENEELYGGDFSEVLLTVEHREAGLHLVLELCARGEHKTDESTIEIRVSGRSIDFEPRPGEEVAAYTGRVAGLVASPTHPEAQRLQFERWVQRIRDALAGALPDARVSGVATAVRVMRVASGAGGSVKAARRGEAGYDPLCHHYPNPMEATLTAVFWGAMATWAWHPSYEVVDEDGTVAGTTEALGAVRADALGPAGDESAEAPWADEESFSATDEGEDEAGRSGNW